MAARYASFIVLGSKIKVTQYLSADNTGNTANNKNYIAYLERRDAEMPQSGSVQDKIEEGVPHILYHDSPTSFYNRGPKSLTQKYSAKKEFSKRAGNLPYSRLAGETNPTLKSPLDETYYTYRIEPQDQLPTPVGQESLGYSMIVRIDYIVKWFESLPVPHSTGGI